MTKIRAKTIVKMHSGGLNFGIEFNRGTCLIEVIAMLIKHSSIDLSLATPVFLKALGTGSWINIEDSHPECIEGHKVLGHNGRYAFECEFDDGFWCNIGGEEMTHWMPLLDLPSK